MDVNITMANFTIIDGGGNSSLQLPMTGVNDPLRHESSVISTNAPHFGGMYNNLGYGDSK